MLTILGPVRFRLPNLPREPNVQAPSARWKPDKAEKLRELWLASLSVNAIAEEMGISRNAVTGKAARLGLPARPNPVKRK